MTPRPRPAGPSGAPDEPTSRDALLGGRVVMDQPAAGYRAAIDPVLLAAAAPVAPGDRVLDLGCGTGAAALCLLARVPELRVTGLDLQIELVRMAGANARTNGVAARFVPMVGDVARLPPRLAPASFDHVMCNPPHLKAGAGRPSPDRARDLATREGPAGLADWVGAALVMARTRGSLTFIHRADRLDDLLGALKGKAGNVTVFPLWPKRGSPARRILVQARKGAAGPLGLCPGMVLHEADGAFTAAAEAVLREAAPLVI